MDRRKLPKEVQDKIAELNKAIFRQEADRAAEIYQTILRHDPEFVLREPVQYDLARLLDTGRQAELALAAYRILIKQQPMHQAIMPVLKAAGTLAYKAKLYDECLDYFERFLEGHPMKADQIEVQDLMSRLPPDLQLRVKATASRDDIRLDNVTANQADSKISLDDLSIPSPVPLSAPKKENSGSIKMEWMVDKTPTPPRRQSPLRNAQDMPSIDIWADAKPGAPRSGDARGPSDKNDPKRQQPEGLLLGLDLPPTPAVRPSVFPSVQNPNAAEQIPAQVQQPVYPPPGMNPMPPPGYYPAYVPPPGYYPPPGFMLTPIPGGYAPPGYYPGHAPMPVPPSGTYPLPPGQPSPQEQQPPSPPAPIVTSSPAASRTSKSNAALPRPDQKKFPPAHAVSVTERYSPPGNESPEARYQRLRDAQFALILPLNKRIHLESVAEFVAKKEGLPSSEANKRVLRRKGLLYDELTLAEVLEMAPLAAECRQSLTFVCVPRQLRPYENFEVTSAEAREQGLKMNIGAASKRVRWDDIHLINCGRIGNDSFATILGSEPMKEYRFSLKTFEFASVLPTQADAALPELFEFIDMLSNRAPDAVLSHTAQALLNERSGVPQPFGNLEEFNSYTLWMLFSRRAEIIDTKELHQLSQITSNW